MFSEIDSKVLEGIERKANLINSELLKELLGRVGSEEEVDFKEANELAENIEFVINFCMVRSGFIDWKVSDLYAWCNYLVRVLRKTGRVDERKWLQSFELNPLVQDFYEGGGVRRNVLARLYYWKPEYCGEVASLSRKVLDLAMKKLEVDYSDLREDTMMLYLDDLEGIVSDVRVRLGLEAENELLDKEKVGFWLDRELALCKAEEKFYIEGGEMSPRMLGIISREAKKLYEVVGVIQP